MTKINWDDPNLVAGKIVSIKKRPSAEELDVILQRMRDKLHTIVNNTFRLAGVDIEGRASEVTWQWCGALMDKVQSDIFSRWTDDDITEDPNKTEAPDGE